MPADSLAALRDFESQFSAALTTILAPFAASPYSAQLVSHDFVADETDAELSVPRLEYDLAVGEPYGPEGAILLRPIYNCQITWSGTLNFRHVYDPRKILPATAGAFRGDLRTLLSPESNAFTVEVLPWLKIDSLNETSSVRGRFKDDKDQQLAEWLSTWAIIWSIRHDAWPA